MSQNTEVGAGAEPALRKLRFVKVFPGDHTALTETVKILQEKFTEKASALGIKISNKGKGRDIIPSMPEAVEFRLSGEDLDRYVSTLIRRAQTILGKVAV